MKNRQGRTQTEQGPQACSRCRLPISEGQKVCECGKATPFMSFDERRAYEVQQWRAYRESVTV